MPTVEVSARTPAWVKVWDPFVRAAHWALVAAFAIAWLSGDDEPGAIHIWAGHAIGAIIVSRVTWGLIGSGHALFTDFAFGPAAVLAYLKDLLAGHPRRYLGHSPAAAAMIFALLTCVSATVLTGLAANRGDAVSAQAGGTLIATAAAGEHEREARGEKKHGGDTEDSGLGELHGTLANITLALVVVHLLGVALSSRLHHENLVESMITGRKRSDDAAGD